MGIKILIVDDSKDIRFSIIETLKDLDKDYKFFEASSGVECIEIAKKEKVDLILLDLMMPEVDGAETTARLKEDESTKDIPIIIVSGSTEQENVNMGKIIGEAFVEKPFEPDELDRIIKTALKKNKK